LNKTVKWATEGLPFDDVIAGVGARGSGIGVERRSLWTKPSYYVYICDI